MTAITAIKITDLTVLPPLFLSLPRRSVRTNVISSIAGIRNLSRQKITRHTSVLRSPVNAGMWSLVVSHCSVKAAMDSAVMENSMPAVEKGLPRPADFREIAPCDPVAVVEERNEEPVGVRVRPLRRLPITKQRVGLVRQCEDHIRFVFTCVLV